MTAGETDWLRRGEGKRPQPIWSFSTEAPLVSLRLARETGETLAADVSGGLYRLDRQGKLIGVTHGPTPLNAIAWSDTGTGGIALVGEQKLYWFDRHLTFQGWIEHSAAVLGVALEAHGRYAAASLGNCTTVIYDSNRKVARRFNTTQPWRRFEFFVHEPALVASTEYGLLSCHSFGGEMLWQEQLYANVGDLALTGDGRTILMACFTHGIQCHNGRGTQVGSYQTGGTVSKVSTGFVAERIAAATVERQVFVIDAAGQVLWHSLAPDDVQTLACAPVGTGLICGLAGGRILAMEWR